MADEILRNIASLKVLTMYGMQFVVNPRNVIESRPYTDNGVMVLLLFSDARLWGDRYRFGICAMKGQSVLSSKFEVGFNIGSCLTGLIKLP